MWYAIMWCHCTLLGAGAGTINASDDVATRADMKGVGKPQAFDPTAGFGNGGGGGGASSSSSSSSAANGGTTPAFHPVTAAAQQFRQQQEDRDARRSLLDPSGDVVGAPNAKRFKSEAKHELVDYSSQFK